MRRTVRRSEREQGVDRQREHEARLAISTRRQAEAKSRFARRKPKSTLQQSAGRCELRAGHGTTSI